MSASQIRPTRRTGDLARARRELERAEATMLAQQEICERLSVALMRPDEDMDDAGGFYGEVETALASATNQPESALGEERYR